MEVVCRPDFATTSFQALQVMNRSMALGYTLPIESGLGKLTVHVAGKYKTTFRQTFTDPAQKLETIVWHGGPVEIKSMAVKPPGQPGIAFECRRTGDTLKRDARLSERGVGSPEPLRTAKIGQPRVDTHSCACRDQKAVGSGDQFGTAPEIVRRVLHRVHQFCRIVTVLRGCSVRRAMADAPAPSQTQL